MGRGIIVVGVTVAFILSSADAMEWRMGDPVLDAARISETVHEGPDKYAEWNLVGKYHVRDYHAQDGSLIKRTIDIFPEGAPDGIPDLVEFYVAGELAVRERMSPSSPPESTGQIITPPVFAREIWREGKCVYEESNASHTADLLLLRDERMTSSTFHDGPGGRFEIFGFADAHHLAVRQVGLLDDPNRSVLWGETDRNGDGRIDEIRNWEEDGFRKTTVYLDDDFDGRADTKRVEWNNDQGEITRTETSTLTEGEIRSLMGDVLPQAGAGAPGGRQTPEKALDMPEGRAAGETRAWPFSILPASLLSLALGVGIGAVGTALLRRRKAG